MKYRSTTHYVLASLMPYTEANLKLTFRPSLFFADLAKLDKLKQNTVANAYYRAVRRGFIEIDATGTPRLTDKGLSRVRPYNSKKLKGAQLMVIFDIPESERNKRQHLRLLLRELSFKQVQKSVWTSNKDHREYIRSEIDQLNLGSDVLIYECRVL